MNILPKSLGIIDQQPKIRPERRSLCSSVFKKLGEYLPFSATQVL